MHWCYYCNKYFENPYVWRDGPLWFWAEDAEQDYSIGILRAVLRLKARPA